MSIDPTSTSFLIGMGFTGSVTVVVWAWRAARRLTAPAPAMSVIIPGPPAED